MVYRALTSVLLGNRPPVTPGELIPDTYLDLNGTPQPVDFDRLVESGLAEQVSEPKPAEKPAEPAPKPRAHKRRTVKEN